MQIGNECSSVNTEAVAISRKEIQKKEKANEYLDLVSSHK